MYAGVFNNNIAEEKHFFVTSRISLVVILASHSCTVYQWGAFIEADNFASPIFTIVVKQFENLIQIQMLTYVHLFLLQCLLRLMFVSSCKSDF